MSKYRKKPVVIEATRWFKNGDHPEDYSSETVGFENGELRTFTGEYRKAREWEGGIVRYFRRPDIAGETACKHCGECMDFHGWIDTLEGGHIVCPGDWVIAGVKGEFYPCKPDIFAVTYAPVDEAAESDLLQRALDALESINEWLLDSGGEIRDRENWNPSFLKAHDATLAVLREAGRKS